MNGKKLKYQIHIIIMFMCSSAVGQVILDKPIIFDNKRKELSLLYLQERYGLEKEFPEIQPKIVVVHWTGLPDLEASHRLMNEPTLSEFRTDIQKGGSLNVSAHYLIGRAGEIYRMLPDTVFARHVIGLNYFSIGIENVGNEANPLTEAQLRANIDLIKMLKEKFDIQYVIGHYEYKSFIGHPLWQEKDNSYLTEKTDPGAVFMEKLRNALESCRVSGPPDIK